jgi:hypothetical protein
MASVQAALGMIDSSVRKVRAVQSKPKFDPAQPTEFDTIEQFDEAIIRYLGAYLILLPTMVNSDKINSASKILATIAMDSLPFDIICILTQHREVSLLDIMLTPDLKYATLYRLICPAVTRQLLAHKRLAMPEQFIAATMFAGAFMWFEVKKYDDCFTQVAAWVQEWITHGVDLQLIENFGIEMLKHQEWQVHGAMIIYYVNCERRPSCKLISDTIIFLATKHRKSKLGLPAALKLLSLLSHERGEQLSPLQFAYLRWRITSAAADTRRRCERVFRRSALILQKNPLARAWQLLTL